MSFVNLVLLSYSLGVPERWINGGKRWPSSADDKFMSSFIDPGTYQPSMLDTEGKIKCDRGGMYVIGSDVSSEEMTAHEDLDGEKRLTKLDRYNALGEVSISGDCFNVICANRAGWSYASTCNGETFDIFEREDNGDEVQKEKEAKVGVVGCGVAGLSAARALMLEGINASSIQVICKPGSSTTEISTGVMFFPDPNEYTSAYIDEKVPADQKGWSEQVDDAGMVSECTQAYDYWKDDLKLRNWSLGAFKPKDYQGGTGSRTAISCESGDCGQDLIDKLSRGLQIIRGIVTKVRLHVDGRFHLTYTVDGTETTSIVSVLIVGAGGNGKMLYPNTTHAIGNDPPVALDVATSLGLRKAGEGAVTGYLNLTWVRDQRLNGFLSPIVYRIAAARQSAITIMFVV